MQTDRLAGNGKHTISTEMEEVAIKGLYRVEVRDESGDAIRVALEISTKRIRVLPTIGQQKRYRPLDLIVIHATERDATRRKDESPSNGN
jgi:hypothetical protein